MTLDPLMVGGAFAAMGGLLLLIVRLFATGAILPRSAVPREDYEELRRINATYADGLRQAVEAIKVLTASVDRITRNGGR